MKPLFSLFLIIMITLNLESCSNNHPNMDCHFVSIKTLFTEVARGGSNANSYFHYVYIQNFNKKCIDSTTFCQIAFKYIDTARTDIPIGCIKFYCSLKYYEKGEVSQDWEKFNRDCLVEIYIDVETKKIEFFRFYDSGGLEYNDTKIWSTITSSIMNNENDPNVAEGDHETMAEGSIGLFVDGMKEFDAQAGTSHSDDWYNAMAWRGSLARASNVYQNLDAATKAQYDNINQNEGNYEGYLKAKFKFERRGTATNQAKMNAALGKVDQALFNQTRNRAADAKIE